MRRLVLFLKKLIVYLIPKSVYQRVKHAKKEDSSEYDDNFSLKILIFSH